ncbi:cutinase-domain-containing protein [Microthyrium microscopicum]|uniref:cutinase n=1 Tax=Microthyrium microscopicum TaxID=703497 RepID=A0A6A6UMJ4_9PEZI|nr:cutinase-domain-containing protein [Microthyrium microscopicum]
MRSTLILGLASLALAQKGKVDPGGTPGNRGPNTENDLSTGGCRDVYFIMARASTEAGNMGGSMGPILCKGLRAAYGQKVGCQGVGAPYTAALADNAKAKGTTEEAITEATKMFTTAHSKCPKALIAFCGYSQGAAVMHNTVQALPEDVKKQVVGGVTFGDTRAKQDGFQIKNYPKDNIMIFCAKENNPPDSACEGKGPNSAHFLYTTNGEGPIALDFLKKKIDGALGGRQMVKKRGPSVLG